MTDKQKEDIIKIMMTPIECTGYSNGNPSIKIENGVIKTTQTYYPYKEWNGEKVDIPLDPDMSDFAIGFYEILYKDILSEKILASDDGLTNNQYAGDTMNSFNTIANRVTEAGKTTKCRKPEDQWPQWLIDYHHRYHCLANFWMVPLEVGRKLDNISFCKASYDNGICDYMDRFISFHRERFQGFKERYPDYYSNMKNYNDFENEHCLHRNFICECGHISKFSHINDTKKMVSEIIRLIRKRAESIVDYDFAEQLLSYFEKNSLLMRSVLIDVS